MRRSCRMEKTSHPDERNRLEWERRSRFFGASLEGVLFKGLPHVVNGHLDGWHKKVILDFIEEKDELKILDVGCGYGRLSIPLIEKFPKINITGLDISESYALLYQERTGHPARIGAIEDLSGELGTFDYILCVTVLMYLDDDRLRKAISNLLFHLKPEGKLILIEPHVSGHPFQTGFGLSSLLGDRIQRNSINTKGRYFRSGEIETRFGNAGGKVLSEQRLPITSLFFLPIALAGKMLPDGIVRGICEMVSLFDALLGRLKLPSIHVAYLISRDED